MAHGSAGERADARADQGTLPPLDGIVARCQAHSDSGGGANKGALGRLAGFAFARVGIHRLATRQHHSQPDESYSGKFPFHCQSP